MSKIKKFGNIILFLTFVIILYAGHSSAGIFDDILRNLQLPEQSTTDTDTTVAGLKKALTIGTGNAVSAVSKIDGYFKNEAIKILLPENIQNIANILSKIGYQKEVDEFILSMNRAAEKATPKAKDIFISAIKEMTFDDARKILTGGETSATDYFKSKTFNKLYESFKPIISNSMNEVGTTKAYKNMMNKYTSMSPFFGMESIDLDHYVTKKALDGLFYMLALEEKKIRTDPSARVTELLRKVFGR